MSRALALAALAVLGACSVPDVSLDGKQCPCTTGYVCFTATNTCVRSMDIDGGPTPDVPPAGACLSGTPGAVLYTYNSDFATNWTAADTTWSGSALQIAQTDTANMSTFAFVGTQRVTAASYRVIAAMHQTAGGMGTPRLGIALRTATATTNKSQYDCLWEPKTGTLLVTSTSGGNTTTLATAPAVSGVNANASVTMEAEITDPASISCCLREHATAKLLGVTDGAVAHPTGQPGLTTQRMAAAFDTYTVYTAP